MTSPVAELLIERAEDVYALRHSGRLAAAALGRDDPDQVRLATALSELGREIVAHGGVARAIFSLSPDGSLEVHITPFPHAAIDSRRSPSAVESARRLLGKIEIVEQGADVSIVLRTPAAPRGHAVRDEDLRRALTAGVAQRPLDELRLENHDLIVALTEVRTQQELLLQLNAELEETNRGVMAMYSQLSDELEETNRGVVALYAELDDKTVQLNAANEAKSRFLASVSHELRSPVNSIRGLTRILMDSVDAAPLPDQQKQLDLIHSSSKELLKLVNGLLDISKAESGKLEAEVTCFSLDSLLADLRGSLRPLVPPGVRLDVHDDTGTTIESDRTLLGQVLRNLLANALKFTVEGSVSLSCAQPDGYQIEISVSDTGIGIAPEDRPRVFEEFYQVRGPLQAKQKGTGLGLPYARRVTELLGGTLSLESELGRGSTFTARLPVAWQSFHFATREVANARDVRVGTALIIDDDEGLRVALRGMLQGIARQVYEAGGGTEGLEKMHELHPDIVFLDLRMPDLDGSEVFREARKDPGLRDIPIVIVSTVDIGPENTIGTAPSIAKAALSRDSVAHAIAKAQLWAGAAP